MRRRIIWLAVVLPVVFYLLVFLNEGLRALGFDTSFGRSHWQIEQLETGVAQVIPILIALAIGLGVVNLFSVHGANLLRGRKDRVYSLVVFASFALVSGALLYQYRLDAQRRELSDNTAAAREKLAAAQQLQSVSDRDRALQALTAEDWVAIHRFQDYDDAYRFDPRRFYVDYVNTPLAATVMALLGFYITYAAYRAFRIRTTEATLMMLAAAVVILGSDPLGGWLTRGGLTHAADFVNTVLNSGMQRGLWLGIHVATITACLRIVLGYERGVIEVRGSGE